MDVGATFTAGGQAPVLVLHGQGLLHDPAVGSDLVAGSSSWDVGGVPSVLELVVDPRIVVALVRDQGRDLLPWPAGTSPSGRTRSSSSGSTRWSLMLAADCTTASGSPLPQVRMWCFVPGLAAVDRAGPGVGAPFSPARASRPG